MGCGSVLLLLLFVGETGLSCCSSSVLAVIEFETRDSDNMRLPIESFVIVVVVEDVDDDFCVRK